MDDVSLLLCEQPEVHTEAHALRAQLHMLQQCVEGMDEAVWTWSPSEGLQPMSRRASEWWEHADAAEQADMLAWVVSVPLNGAASAECDLEWSAAGRRVLHARCLSDEHPGPRPAACTSAISPKPGMWTG
ncbi:hypothetical protein [Rhodoferax sp.]|uniref:hypothetical protein n=1 Tax=Rhodoferax sp. TaxID=50421 RepID=UPI0025D38C0B|nr:hypothetical protein [Rhodoferax sp.]